MKINLTLLLIVFCLASMNVHSQKWRLNASGGIDAAKTSVSFATGQQISGKTGVGAGLDLEINCSPTISVQLGAHYSQQGFSLVPDDPNKIASVSLHVITVPLLLRLKATPHLHLLVGPQLGYIPSAKVRTNSEPAINANDDIADFDYYAVVGASYRFTNNIFAEGRYHFGFNNLSGTGSYEHYASRYFSLRVGYSFPLGKK